MITPVLHIRQVVFGCATQQAFADLLGTTQATVSRWEANGCLSKRGQSLVRGAAVALDIIWDDRWFFAPPANDADPAPSEDVA